MPALTKENLGLLISLQEKDKGLDALRSAIESIPVAIKTIQDEVEVEKKRFADMKSGATRLQIEKKDKENELQAKEDSIAKHQKELNAVKSNEAFKALIVEIDKAKQEKDGIEEQILLVMEKVDQFAKVEKDELRKVKEKEAEAQGRIGTLEADKAGREKELAERIVERDALAAQVSPELLNRYDSLRRKKNGLAVVPLRGHSCGGCNMQITPQVFVEATRASTLVSCEGCGRILHL